jgi:hypothetical protein
MKKGAVTGRPLFLHLEASRKFGYSRDAMLLVSQKPNGRGGRKSCPLLWRESRLSLPVRCRRKLAIMPSGSRDGYIFGELQ